MSLKKKYQNWFFNLLKYTLNFDKHLIFFFKNIFYIKNIF